MCRYHPSYKSFFQLEMRDMFRTLSVTVYDDLERVLTLTSRGCLGLNPRADTLSTLRYMRNDIDSLQKLIKQERAIPAL